MQTCVNFQRHPSLWLSLPDAYHHLTHYTTLFFFLLYFSPPIRIHASERQGLFVMRLPMTVSLVPLAVTVR